MTVDHQHPHPNGTPAHQSWSQDQTLHVAAVYSNPCRWRTRLYLFNDFRRHMESLPNVKLYVTELAYGDRPFEVTSSLHPRDLQLRSRDIVWHKENLSKVTVNRFEPGWEFGAQVDGDTHFTRNDIALETIHQLQRYDWAQMFSTYADLGPDHRPLRIMKSFANRFASGELSPEIIAARGISPVYGSGSTHTPKGLKTQGVGATGLAWAFRRSSYEQVGGFLDTCILGSGDWHMAFGLAGEPDTHPNVAEMTRVGEPYAQSIRNWQNRAARAVRKNVGYVNCHAIHYFHGSKQRRGYGERWKILRDNAYDPAKDVYYDANGVLQLHPDRITLRDDIRRYFDSRTEDDISILPGDGTLDGAMQ